MIRMLWIALSCLYFSNLSAATYYAIDTTKSLYCYLSSKFQNRIMIENGRIKKVISTECERLSIQIEEMTGQAFVYARDPFVKETSISVVSDTGVVQDIHICFLDRMSEVVILNDLENEECQIDPPLDEKKVEDSYVLNTISEILSGNIPKSYSACSISKEKWTPKKGIELSLKSKLEGPSEILYIYEAVNKLKQPQILLECEIECKGCKWVYLETNSLLPKQKNQCMIAVSKYE